MNTEDKVLREQLLAIPLQTPIQQDLNVPQLTAFDIENSVANTSLFDSYRVPKWEHHGMTYKGEYTNQGASRGFSFPSEQVKHRDLIRWITLYRATGGLGFEVNI